MKALKFVRGILVVLALVFALFWVLNARYQLAQQSESVQRVREILGVNDAEAATEPETIPETTNPKTTSRGVPQKQRCIEEDIVEVVEEPEVVEEVPPKYDWCVALNSYETEGIISIHYVDPENSDNVIDIEVACQVGGQNSETISGNVCGLHPQISNQNHLFILAHNNTNWYRTHGYSRLNTAFTYLTDVDEGAEVLFETVHGYTYRFVIDEMRIVDEATYAADNYSILCGDEDLVLATCCWDSNWNRGRLVCFCTLTEVTPNN